MKNRMRNLIVALACQMSILTVHASNDLTENIGAAYYSTDKNIVRFGIQYSNQYLTDYGKLVDTYGSLQYELRLNVPKKEDNGFLGGLYGGLSIRGGPHYDWNLKENGFVRDFPKFLDYRWLWEGDRWGRYLGKFRSPDETKYFIGYDLTPFEKDRGIHFDLRLTYDSLSGFHNNRTERIFHCQRVDGVRQWSTTQYNIPDYFITSLSISKDWQWEEATGTAFIKLEDYHMLGSASSDVPGCILEDSQHPQNGGGFMVTVGYRGLNFLEAGDGQGMALRWEVAIEADDGIHGYKPSGGVTCTLGLDIFGKEDNNNICFFPPAVTFYVPFEDRHDGRGSPCVFLSITFNDEGMVPGAFAAGLISGLLK